MEKKLPKAQFGTLVKNTFKGAVSGAKTAYKATKTAKLADEAAAALKAKRAAAAKKAAETRTANKLAKEQAAANAAKPKATKTTKATAPKPAAKSTAKKPAPNKTKKLAPYDKREKWTGAQKATVASLIAAPTAGVIAAVKAKSRKKLPTGADVLKSAGKYKFAKGGSAKRK